MEEPYLNPFYIFREKPLVAANQRGNRGIDMKPFTPFIYMVGALMSRLALIINFVSFRRVLTFNLNRSNRDL